MKRRPRPLDLRGEGSSPRVDPELQEHLDDIASSISITTGGESLLVLLRPHADPIASSLSDELQDLTVLRDTVHRNLRDRPVVSPHPLSAGSGFATPSTPDSAPPDLAPEDLTDIPELHRLLSSPTPTPLLIVDTRALGPYLDAHLPRSVNLSIPTLIFKRLRKGIGAKMTWSGLAAFVTTDEGKAEWEALEAAQGLEVVIMGSWGWDDTARGLLPILRELVPGGKVTLAKGGWQAVEGDSSFATVLERTAVAGPSKISTPARPSAPLRSSTLPLLHSKQPQTAPSLSPEMSFLLAPPTPPIEPVPRLANQLSMPSLRAKRGQPTLSLNTGGGKKPLGLSLDTDRPIRSATVSSFPRSPTNLRSPGLLKIDTTVARDQLSSGPSSPSLHKLNGHTPQADQTLYAEPELIAIPRTPVMTARNAMSPFIVSTILPGFLYLGPEITNDEDVATLRRNGVKRILNVAKECDEEGLGLKETFERYFKIPMRDTVEESGVGKGMRDACNYLDDARLHDAPTYVHCRAGKSRSVTVVLAYLIHANAWTLKTAYAYVAERRKGISPNIGFVAELMQFEEAELGVKQSGGVHGESGEGERQDDEGTEGKGSQGRGKTKGQRYARESLPPAWGSLGSNKPSWISSFSDEPAGAEGEERQVKEERKVDEREVRKNGQWVQQRRRVPVDRSTLQPGRRASKAGLESLRGLAGITSARPSPQPSPGVEGGSSTPSAGGRLGWI
ncbi:uncharacterized protein MKK02DRAFT_22401 [Dioszegia hungarica]|uniref:protein-tyrosine-phosphatase n=1 Tax=Dioszegia hungarica TaxID=4972 RepID=A0AA38HCQ8_9TREE|nr:uncharacterized protein MKK02DRAFT_22401 [Dioszegia hungarica]KAI9637836.1 hypothetical protein MKK02DRAFT_22401 [Dioszegia hungarica]